MEYFIVGIIVAVALLATLSRFRTWLNPGKQGSGCGCDCSTGCTTGGRSETTATGCCSDTTDSTGACGDCQCGPDNASQHPGGSA